MVARGGMDSPTSSAHPPGALRASVGAARIASIAISAAMTERRCMLIPAQRSDRIYYPLARSATTSAVPQSGDRLMKAGTTELVVGLVLVTGFAFGVVLMLWGAFSMSQSSPVPGGSVPTVLGFLMLAVGAAITGITLVAGAGITGTKLVATLISRAWGSLSHSAKRKVKWGVLIAWVAWFSIYTHLYWQPSAVAERQRVAAERAQLKAERAQLEEERALLKFAARMKFEGTNESLIGMWQNVAEPNYVIVFGYVGTAYRTDGAEIQYYEDWNLCYRSDVTPAPCKSPVSFTDPSSALQVDFRSNRGIVAYEISQFDDSQLVIEHLFDSGNKTAIHKDSVTQSFSRVTDAVMLKNFRTRGAVMMNRAQPDAETKIIDGVTHRFFREPVPALASNAWISSSPDPSLRSVTSLSEGDSVELIAVTDIKHHGTPWFLIRYRDGLSGYTRGGNLCPKEIWIDGLRTPHKWDGRIPPRRFPGCVAP